MNFSIDDPSKTMVNLSNLLMKKRKWPYRGWHKRFFLLQNGYLIYGKSEQEVNIFFFQSNSFHALRLKIKRGRYNGKCDIGLCIITYIRELQRINIDETNSVYHIKIKEKKLFDQWLEQISIHRNFRQKQLENQTTTNEQTISNEPKPTLDDKTSSDRLFYNGFSIKFPSFFLL